MQEQEIWKDIVGYKGLYQVSNLGRVKSLARKIDHGTYIEDRGDVIMSLVINTHGYYSVVFTKNRKKKNHRVHQLVARAFIPNPENKEMINHIDCNRLNNRVDNLEWCTNSENQLHAIAHGLKTDIGVNHKRSRLNEEEVKFIREHYRFRSPVYNTRTLAEMFNVSRTVISTLVLGKTYKSVV